MATVQAPQTGLWVRVTTCRSCHAPVYWSTTRVGKRAPFDIDQDGKPLETSHFATCPDAKQWSQKGR
jgi:hypothetical protein